MDDTELIESAWGQPIDGLDRFDSDWDWPRRGRVGGWATGRIEDRQGGKFRPVFESEADLDTIRATADVLCETSPNAIGALKNLTNFVIGQGFVYSAAPKPKQEVDKQLVAMVQAIVDEFLEANEWCGDRERELFSISRRHGEYFLGLYDHDGMCEVRNVAAARVKEPKGLPNYNCSTTFGVETHADDLECEHGYWVQWDSLDGQLEFVESEHCEHVKINVDRGIKRGVSDFFAVDPDMEAARTLLRNMVRGGSIQAAIAYIVEHGTGVTQGQIENLRSQNATLKYDQTSQANGTQTQYSRQLKAGQRLDVGKGQQYKGSPLASGEAANAYVTILQAGLRSIGSRWCMPEYMISGDASNANYSSTMVAESPFVRNCEVEQSFYKRKFLRVIWAAVKIAAEANRFAGKTFEEIRKLVEIQVECPPVAARNALQETQRNQLLKAGGVLSDKTWAGREGLDYEQEKTNIATQPKPQPILPPVAAALESVRTTEEAKAILESYP